MKKTRKGFTLVELLVVIAIVAILATVAIIGYTSFTKKAEMSNDRTLVAELNTAVTKADGKYTIHEAAELLRDHGFDISLIDATAKNQEILWDNTNGQFFYTADGTPENAEIWIIDDVVSETYNTYYIGGESIRSNTSKAICVATNGTNLTINAPNAEVYHYGDVANLTIEVVKDASYHEYGRVTGLATVQKGRVVVENGGSIGTLVVTSTEVTLSGDFGVVMGTSDVLAALGNITAEKVPVASVENVSNAIAYVGDTFYDDFAAAFTANKTGTIVLLKDFVYEAVSTNAITLSGADTNLVLDLNGHVVTAKLLNTSSCNLITLKSGATLTIKDSTAGANGIGNGMLKVTELYDSDPMNVAASVISVNQANLILDSGILYNENSKCSWGAYGVDVLTNGNGGDASLVVNGGMIKSETYRAIRGFCNSTTNTVKITINGGKVCSNNNNAIWLQDPSDASGNKGVLTITGGVIESAGYTNAGEERFAINLGNDAITSNITGGTFVQNGTDVTSTYVK